MGVIDCTGFPGFVHDAHILTQSELYQDFYDNRITGGWHLVNALLIIKNISKHTKYIIYESICSYGMFHSSHFADKKYKSDC